MGVGCQRLSESSIHDPSTWAVSWTTADQHRPARDRPDCPPRRQDRRGCGTKALSQVPELFRFGVHARGDAVLAEEMAQETFIKFCRRAGSYGSARGPVRAWLFTMARTTAYDIARRPSSRPFLPSGTSSCRPTCTPCSTFCGAQAPPPVTRYASGSWMASWIGNGDRWAGTFPVGGTTGGARTRQQAVTVATLLATPTEIAAAQAMTVIDEFAPDSAA